MFSTRSKATWTPPSEHAGEETEQDVDDRRCVVEVQRGSWGRREGGEAESEKGTMCVCAQGERERRRAERAERRQERGWHRGAGVGAAGEVGGDGAAWKAISGGGSGVPSRGAGQDVDDGGMARNRGDGRGGRRKRGGGARLMRRRGESGVAISSALE